MTARWLALPMLFLGCSARPEPEEVPVAGDEVSPEVVTRWTDKTELFVEYPALSVGRTSRFAIHLTDLASFEPLRQGRVSVELSYPDGNPESFSVQGPSRPGVFGIDVLPRRRGQTAMTIRIRSGALSDDHALGSTPVFGPREFPGQTAHPDPRGAGIEEVTYLKEQQWALDFATELVDVRSMRRSVRVPAIVRPTSGGTLTVVAPVSGRLVASAELPALGDSVEPGGLLCAIAPAWAGQQDLGTLEFALDESRLGIESAKRERLRMERLLSAGAVPARRLEQAVNLEELALARHKSARERMEFYEATRRGDSYDESRRVFEVRSHIAGVVTSLSVSAGARVEEGDVLLQISAVDPIYLTGAIPESQASMLVGLRGAEIEFPGSDILVPAGKLVSKGLLVDPATRTLGITFLAGNEGRRLAIGQSLYLHLLTSEAVESTTIPVSALVEDGARTVVYVQIGGESFERRPVILGNRRGTEAQVIGGLAAGELVVTNGAYLIHLASKSTEAPAHGHVH